MFRKNIQKLFVGFINVIIFDNKSQYIWQMIFFKITCYHVFIVNNFK